MDWSSRFITLMPHGMCLSWRPELMLLHIVSDALIAIAYLTIPFLILRFVRARPDLENKHRALALLFASFIGFCGLTHIGSIAVLWVPIYAFEGWLKAVTGVVSVATAVMLIALVDKIIKLPSLKAMQAEIDAHRETMAALDAAHAVLALKVIKTEDELRETEQNRHQSTALLSTVIEAVPGLVFAKDRSSRILLANKATLALIGKPWSEIQGKRDDAFLSDSSQARAVIANDKLVMDSGKSLEVEEIVTDPVKGRRIWHSIKSPFADSSNNIIGMVGLSIDITERKQLARELLHVSRRSAMGEMATAIAHEINQPLAAIALYVGGSITLLGDDDVNAPVVKSLKLANEQCLRASDIIRRLRSFVSGGDDVKQPENMATLVNAACAMALIGSKEEGIASTITHRDLDLFVMAERVQIEQVVVNLVRNAIDALKGMPGGAVSVTTEKSDEGVALLTVSDNGPGINPEVADRLFEAFVSTKGVKGMGVGLSICRTIVEAHGGKIWAEPGADGGAAFRFTLPLAKLEAAA